MKIKFANSKTNKKIAFLMNEMDELSSLSKKEKSKYLISLLIHEEMYLCKDISNLLSKFTMSMSDFLSIDTHPNKVIYNFLGKINQEFDSFTKNEDLNAKQIKNNKDNKNAIDVEMSYKFKAIELISSINSMYENIDFLTKLIDKIENEKKSVVKSSRIKASNLYPLKNTRISLASKCVKSSIGELNKTLTFLDNYDLSMTEMFVSDSFNHYNLGVCFLIGHPIDISSASNMDTASRDGLDEDVFDFAMKISYSGIKEYSDEAIKNHREKLKIREIKKSAKQIKNHVKSSSHKARVPKKI